MQFCRPAEKFGTRIDLTVGEDHATTFDSGGCKPKQLILLVLWNNTGMDSSSILTMRTQLWSPLGTSARLIRMTSHHTGLG